MLRQGLGCAGRAHDGDLVRVVPARKDCRECTAGLSMLWATRSEYALENTQGDTTFVDDRPDDMLTRELVAPLAYQLGVSARRSVNTERAVIVALVQGQVRRRAVQKIRRRFHRIAAGVEGACIAAVIGPID